MKNLTIKNNPEKAGKRAGKIEYFDNFRYSVTPIHTRFSEVEWFVKDATKADPVTGMAEVIGQHSTRQQAFDSLPAFKMLEKISF